MLRFAQYPVERERPGHRSSLGQLQLTRLGRTAHSDSWRSALWRWATFNLVGTSGVSIQLLILTALINSGFHYLIATALAVQVAVLNNFAWC